MATESGTDPNQQRDEERARGKDHVPPNEAKEWDALNPVRETPTPFGGLKDGGAGQ